MSLVSGLMEMRNMIDQILETGGTSSKATKLNKSGKPKKESTRAGKPPCPGDFVKMMCVEHKAEIAAFKAANPDMKGAHLTFVGTYKKEHAEEFATFEAEWKEAHPKDSSVSDSEKPKRVVSEETKAKQKAARELKKATAAVESSFSAMTISATPATLVAAPEPEPAPVPEPNTFSATTVTSTKKPKAVKTAKKAITTPVVAPIDTSGSQEELLPFSYNGGTYLRMGTQRPDGNPLWSSGHLWMSKKGVKGPHYGELQTDGTVDMEAAEPVA